VLVVLVCKQRLILGNPKGSFDYVQEHELLCLEFSYGIENLCMKEKERNKIKMEAEDGDFVDNQDCGRIVGVPIQSSLPLS
jgi:hypothetical protein